jgi:hypothetical protein
MFFDDSWPRNNSDASLISLCLVEASDHMAFVRTLAIHVLHCLINSILPDLLSETLLLACDNFVAVVSAQNISCTSLFEWNDSVLKVTLSSRPLRVNKYFLYRSSVK